MHAARYNSSPRLRRVHKALEAGAELSTLEIALYARVCAVSTCVSELREGGAVITCRRADRDGERRWVYQMLEPIPPDQREDAA